MIEISRLLRATQSRTVSTCGIALLGIAMPLPAFAQAAEAAPPTCGPGAGDQILRKVIQVPPTGKVAEVQAGDVMLTTETLSIAQEGVRLDSPTTAHGSRAGGAFTVTVPAGEYSEVGRMKTAYRADQATFKYDKDSRERSGLSKPDIGVLVNPANPSVLLVRLGFGLSSQELPLEGAAFDVKRCSRSTSSGPRFEILFSGSTRGTITLQYREYSNGIARPAFSQEASFDLTDGKVIAFKNARFRIDSVSNVGIRYVVEKGWD